MIRDRGCVLRAPTSPQAGIISIRLVPRAFMIVFIAGCSAAR